MPDVRDRRRPGAADTLRRRLRVPRVGAAAASGRSAGHVVPSSLPVVGRATADAVSLAVYLEGSACAVEPWPRRFAGAWRWIATAERGAD